MHLGHSRTIMVLLQCQPLWLATLLLRAISSTFAAASKAIAFYDDSACTDVPLSMQVSNSSLTCTPHPCTRVEFGATVYYYNTACMNMTTDSRKYIAGAFTGARHIIVDQFQHQNCKLETYIETHAFQDLAHCVPYTISSVSRGPDTSIIATIIDDNAVNVQFFSSTNCSVQPQSIVPPDLNALASHTCHRARLFAIGTNVSHSFRSNKSLNTSSSGIAVEPHYSIETIESFHSVSSIGAILVVAGVLLGAIGLVMWKWQSRNRTLEHATRLTELMHDSVAMLETDEVVYLSKPQRGHPLLPNNNSTFLSYREQSTLRSLARSNLSFLFQRPGSLKLGSSMIPESSKSHRPWEDECVVAARIPRDQVVIVHVLSRGGFGVVYSGLYLGHHVAIKMLLPETRRSLLHVVDLLAEVKLMASMEHPHIVKFIGVAWDSLANMCLVSEFVAGGDLKALLRDYEEQQYLKGFNFDKLKIALHIAYALTYMHSMDPPIIHRDLKSKNILLHENLDAKLTDFGTSRERVNESMTGGVGTCLWMAPEVMLGDRYDDKADMFSFGVVLSELDTHLIPYWHAKDPNDLSRKMPEPAILQLVASGKLQVEFSKDTMQAVKELGHACVSLDATKRPTASQALYKLHTIRAKAVEQVGNRITQATFEYLNEDIV